MFSSLEYKTPLLLTISMPRIFLSCITFLMRMRWNPQISPTDPRGILGLPPWLPSSFQKNCFSLGEKLHWFTKSEAEQRRKPWEEERNKPWGREVGNLGAEACWGAERGLFITQEMKTRSMACFCPLHCPSGDRRKGWGGFPVNRASQVWNWDWTTWIQFLWIF